MSHNQQSSIQQPLVSVIIPTRNSAETLEACLRSVTAQGYPSLEVIVVDNHSTDATMTIACAATAQVFTAGPERSAQRNSGARAAHGDYVLFIDSDMILAPMVAGYCVAALQKTPSATGVIIPERSLGEGFWARCKAIERSCYIGDDTIEAARFFPRDLFNALGGYDERLTGPEDWEFSQRAAAEGQLVRIEAFITHLEGSLTLKETMRSKFYYGHTMGRYVQVQPQAAVRQIQLIRPAFIRHWRRLITQPHLLVGMAAMKICEFVAAGAGVALGTWRTRINRAA